MRKQRAYCYSWFFRLHLIKLITSICGNLSPCGLRDMSAVSSDLCLPTAIWERKINRTWSEYKGYWNQHVIIGIMQWKLYLSKVQEWPFSLQSEFKEAFPVSQNQKKILQLISFKPSALEISISLWVGPDSITDHLTDASFPNHDHMIHLL